MLPDSSHTLPLRLVLLVLLVLAPFAALLSCASTGTQKAQVQYDLARAHWQEVQAAPERYTPQEQEDATEAMLSAMLALGDSMRNDAKQTVQDVVSIGAISGAGAWGIGAVLLRLAARYTERRHQKEQQSGTEQPLDRPKRIRAAKPQRIEPEPSEVG